MWGAIERISKDLQELIQRDIGIDGEDVTDPALATINLNAVESALARIVSIDPPWSWLADILEEEEASVKHSMISGLRPNNQVWVERPMVLVDNQCYQ